MNADQCAALWSGREKMVAWHKYDTAVGVSAAFKPFLLELNITYRNTALGFHVRECV